MFILGLTGSVGMGKSTVAAMFARCGARVHDADAAVHRLYGPGGAAVPVVGAMFPDAVIGAGRAARIDRVRLGKATFGRPGALQELEAVVHPLVAIDRDRFLRRACRGGWCLAVLDVPLLFETGGERHVDATCVVSAPAFVQAARVLGRPGMTSARLASLLRRQMSDAEKRRRADAVIPTGLSRAHTWSRVVALSLDLKGRPGHVWPPRGGPVHGSRAISGHAARALGA